MRRRGERESGAIALTVSLSMAIVLGMVIASVVLGRKSVSRRELQSAADAVALAAAYSVQQNGLPLRDLPARPYGPANTVMPVTPTFSVLTRPEAEHRIMVRVNLLGSLDSEQAWFQRMFQIRVESHAQVNEQIFGATWPAFVIVLDASQSMKYPIPGSNTLSALNVMKQVITAYAALRLPVRNGLVIFSTAVVQDVPPPTQKENKVQLQKIQSALAKVTPSTVAGTNTREGLRRAGQDLQSMPPGRNVMLITDGDPTLGGPCNLGLPCHYTAAENEADALRNVTQAALFAAEIRRSNSDQQMTSFLQGIAGMPGSAGNDPEMYFLVDSAGGMMQLLIGVASGVCAFGPLTPAPGSGPDPYRLRGSAQDLAGPPQRVFAFFREPNASETPMRMVPDRVAAFNQMGFEYVVEPDGAYVVLTLEACRYLGDDPARLVVVRWDDAQLSPAP